jgi:hypothetical protein
MSTTKCPFYLVTDEGCFIALEASLHPAKHKFHCRIKSQCKFLTLVGIVCDKAPVACLAGNDKVENLYTFL